MRFERSIEAEDILRQETGLRADIYVCRTRYALFTISNYIATERFMLSFRRYPLDDNSNIHVNVAYASQRAAERAAHELYRHMKQGLN